jgi:hypothetical protein
MFHVDNMWIVVLCSAGSPSRVYRYASLSMIMFITNTCLVYKIACRHARLVKRNLQLSSHRMELSCKLRRLEDAGYIRLDGIQVDLLYHSVEEVADLRQSATVRWSTINAVRLLTGFACHLPPPTSNQER